MFPAPQVIIMQIIYQRVIKLFRNLKVFFLRNHNLNYVYRFQLAVLYIVSFKKTHLNSKRVHHEHMEDVGFGQNFLHGDALMGDGLAQEDRQISMQWKVERDLQTVALKLRITQF